MQFRMLTLACAGPLLAACAHHDPADPGEFAYSEPAVPPPPATITRFADEDRDGFVTEDEAKADPWLAKRFGDYDVDDNGKLDRGEFARLEAEARERRARASHPDEEPRPSARAEPMSKPWFGPARHDTLNRTGAARDGEE